MTMKKEKKTLEEQRAVIERNYRAMFLLLSLSLALTIAFFLQIISQS